MRQIKLGKSENNDEDTIPAEYTDSAPDVNITTLISCLPERLRQTFLEILSLNNMTESFDYTRLLDPLSIRTDTLDPQKAHEVLKLTQSAIMHYYDMGVREYDSETHTISVQVQRGEHSYTTSQYIANALEGDTYRTVTINSDFTPAITYSGSKAWLTEFITKRRITIPQHKVWIEPFCGSAAMTLAQYPQPVEIINDYDSYLTNFYDVLSRPRLRAELIDQISYYMKTPERARELHLPYLRKMTVRAKKVGGQGERRVTKNISTAHADPITLARAFYICSKFDYGFQSLGYLSTFQYENESSKRVTQLTMKKRLAALESVGKRLERVIIESGDGLQLIEKYAHEPDVFFYVDPPYVLSTRRGNAGYANELADGDHEKLVELLLNIEGSAVLSGYSSQAYIKLEREGGWTTLSHEVQTLGGIREEILWIKPPS